MDIGSLSDQGLLGLIVMMAAGSLVFAGLFVGSLVAYLRGRQKKGQAATQLPTPAAPAHPQIFGGGGSKTKMGSLLKSSGPKRNTPASPQKPNEEREQTTAPSPPAVAPVELLRILAHPESGKIVVEVDGQRFSAISRVTERVTGQRILEVAAALLAFTGGLIATANGTKTLPAPTVKLTAWPRSAPPTTDRTAEAETPPPPARRPPRPEPAPTPAARRQPAQAEPDKIRWGFGRKRRQPEEETVEFTAFNLAEEIDDAVQKKLLQANEPMSVKIYSGPGGQITIQVGDNTYNSVDEVNEPRIKALIQSAIEEWNRR